MQTRAVGLPGAPPHLIPRTISVEGLRTSFCQRGRSGSPRNAPKATHAMVPARALGGAPPAPASRAQCSAGRVGRARDVQRLTIPAAPLENQDLIPAPVRTP